MDKDVVYDFLGTKFSPDEYRAVLRQMIEDSTLLETMDIPTNTSRLKFFEEERGPASIKRDIVVTYSAHERSPYYRTDEFAVSEDKKSAALMGHDKYSSSDLRRES